MQNCCKNCHFLAKEWVDSGGRRNSFSWDDQERSDPRIKDNYSAKCAQGIWDTGIDPKLKSGLPELLQKQRGDTCFFVERQAGMSFQAAEKLHKIRYETRNLKKILLRTQWGIYVAAAGVVGELAVLDF